MCSPVYGGKFALAADVTLFHPGSAMLVGSVVYPQPSVGRCVVGKTNRSSGIQKQNTTWFWNRETKTLRKKLWNPGRSESSSLTDVFSSCIVALIGGGRKRVVWSKNARRFGDCPLAVMALCILRPKSETFYSKSLHSWLKSHKNGTFCSFYSCRDLIFKLLLFFFYC